MQRVTVLYPNKGDTRFDFEYYMRKHVPFVEGLVGQKIEVRRGLSSPSGSPAAFVCVGTIPINWIQEFQMVLQKHGPKIMGDIPNYTNSEPIIQFDEVVS
jgi:uncharacterized protein (TIGR02118 family)